MRSQLSTFHLPIFGEERGHKREAVVYGIFLHFPISGEEDRGVAQLLAGALVVFGSRKLLQVPLLVLSVPFSIVQLSRNKLQELGSPIFLFGATPLYEEGSWHSPVNLAKIVEKILLNTYLFMSNREKTNQIQFHSHCLLWT